MLETVICFSVHWNPYFVSLFILCWSPYFVSVLILYRSTRILFQCSFLIDGVFCFSVHSVLESVFCIRSARRVWPDSEGTSSNVGVDLHTESRSTQQRRKPDHIRSIHVENLSKPRVSQLLSMNILSNFIIFSRQTIFDEKQIPQSAPLRTSACGTHVLMGSIRSTIMHG